MISADKTALKVYTSQVRDYLKNEFDNMVYQNFFRSINVLSYERNEVVFSFPQFTDSIINIIKTYYQKNMQKTVKEIFGPNIVYKIVNYDQEQIKEIEKNNEIQYEEFKKFGYDSSVDPNLTFSNYIVGNFNKEAVNICKNLLNKDFLTVYIHSKSGFGKTHLLYAIANTYLSNNKTASYINPTNFTRDIAALLQENDQSKISAVLKHFTNVDVLLLDDFQIYSEGEKKSTKNFLFQIIDGRMSAKKKTVISSECSIDEIKSKFDTRIITRLTSGFTTSIKKPSYEDLEKLFDYFMKKEVFDSSLLDKQSRDFIIYNSSGSIRNLIGSVKRMQFYKDKILTVDDTLEYIKEIFEDTIKNRKEVKPEEIINVVCNYYKLNRKDLLGKSRRKEIVVARHMAIIVIRSYLQLSTTEIGKIFNRDHSTIVNVLGKTDVNNSSIKQVKDLIIAKLYN